MLGDVDAGEVSPDAGCRALVTVRVAGTRPAGRHVPPRPRRTRGRAGSRRPTRPRYRIGSRQHTKGRVEDLNGRARRFLPREGPPEALAPASGGSPTRPTARRGAASAIPRAAPSGPAAGLPGLPHARGFKAPPGPPARPAPTSPRPRSHLAKEPPSRARTCRGWPGHAARTASPAAPTTGPPASAASSRPTRGG